MATSVGALQAQIDHLAERLTAEFSEMKVIMHGIEDRVRKMEQTEAGCFPVVNAKLEQVFRKLEDHDTRIGILEKAVAEISMTNKILRWILSILTGVMVALLVAVVTGKATFMFR
ncbi:MAG: hypothetical protein HPY45_08305 [Anaerolineae bacterium]|nr:hypothetical protein [Anaerolineae bacterium]